MNEKSCRQPPQAKFAQHILCGVNNGTHTSTTNEIVKSAGVHNEISIFATNS